MKLNKNITRNGQYITIKYDSGSKTYHRLWAKAVTKEYNENILKNIMPYLIRHTKSGGYEVVKRADGSVAAHAKSLAGARGYIYHAMKNEPKPERKKKREQKS